MNDLEKVVQGLTKIGEEALRATIQEEIKKLNLFELAWIRIQIEAAKALGEEIKNNKRRIPQKIG